MAEERLEEIDRKLQVIVENSYLSRLDLLFSVLLSLTIFFVGLTIANASLQTEFFSPYWIGLLALLIYTLIGEFWAIIKDDVIRRFKYWIALTFDFVALGFILFVSSTFRYFDSVLALVIPLTWFFLFFLPFQRYADDLFSRYVKRFPSRFKDFPRKAGATILFPSIVGIIIFFVVSFVYLLLVGYS